MLGISLKALLLLYPSYEMVSSYLSHPNGNSTENSVMMHVYPYKSNVMHFV